MLRSSSWIDTQKSRVSSSMADLSDSSNSGNRARVGHEFLELASLEPLGAEVLGERVRPRGSRSIRLTWASKVVSATERRPGRQLEELLVGHATPQEVREPRGEIEVVLRQRCVRRVFGLLQLDTEEKVGRRQAPPGVPRRIADSSLSPSVSAESTIPSSRISSSCVAGRRKRPVGEPAQNIVDLLLSFRSVVRCDVALRRTLSSRGRADRRLVSPEGERNFVHGGFMIRARTSGKRKAGSMTVLRGGQVHLDQDRRHREHFADVVEAIPDIIGREFIGRFEIEADQVADRVVVFGAVEAADRDPPAGVVIGSDRGVEPAVERCPRLGL